MLKYFIFNVKVMVFIVLTILSMHSSYAYNITAIKNSELHYSLRGYITPSDLERVVMPNAVFGLFYAYSAKQITGLVVYNNVGVTCEDNKNRATQIINGVIPSIIMQESNFGSVHDNTIKIYCQIRGVQPRTYWVFNENIGNLADPSSAQCSVSAPLEVSFGTVTIDNNNKTIEKQVTIKCDKATRINLTLQGDGKTNLLTMSGTKIKLGVGGDTQTKGYDVKAEEVTMVSLIFTLSDTGNTPGVKKGYALLISELP